ncbi:glycosyltransferase [Polaribacter sp. NJDZ03]|uniref:glycosyltransferase n=1 Tax=Polaribacter sp. NJDZ03 TaxID=2855841 RepID=UPI001C4A3E59|nr:glycosyltransferase [Polaribacter sp. NJDZ03]
MRFLIITDAPTLQKEEKNFSYAPYVIEMDLWMEYFDDIVIVSPTKYNKTLLVESFKKDIKISSIPSISLISFFDLLKSILALPYILLKLFINMYKADHIHLRNPGSIGLLACFVQIFFPFKPKTSKYAGNWDPESKQPLSYRLQKKILSNTFLTKNCKVLVYGEWENQTKNIIPFFTASYSQKEIIEIPARNLEGKINFIFVGSLTIGKQPLLSVKVIQELSKTKKNIHLDIFGDGAERKCLEDYIKENNLETYVKLHGNVNKNTVKEAFKKAHFLLFISKSEGWPKVVAEAMFWGVLPITSKVSCVPYMIGNGSRGALVESNVASILLVINAYFKKEKNYARQSKEAMEWSQEFTLEKFESEIGKLLND